MSKHDSHDAQHSHGGHPHGSLSDSEKMIKMIEHWIHHTEDHAKSYREWAQRAAEQGHHEVCRILQSLADSTIQQNESMEKAIRLLRG